MCRRRPCWVRLPLAPPCCSLLGPCFIQSTPVWEVNGMRVCFCLHNMYVSWNYFDLGIFWQGTICQKLNLLIVFLMMSPSQVCFFFFFLLFIGIHWRLQRKGKYKSKIIREEIWDKDRHRKRLCRCVFASFTDTWPALSVSSSHSVFREKVQLSQSLEGVNWGAGQKYYWIKWKPFQ